MAAANSNNVDSMTLQEFFANKRTPQIVTLCGSQRIGSFNKILFKTFKDQVIFEKEEGELHEYPLRLPIVATCFMEPVTLEPGAFMQRWRSLEGQDRECQEVVKAPPNVPAIDEEYMKRIANIITDGLKFGRCQGCDPTPWTVSGAATFRTGSKDANGNNINVGCLVRVEANPQAGAFRVTTRTLHPLCSKAVKNVALVSIKLA